MKEIFIILYHNSGSESLEILRDLVKSLKKMGKKILISSHSLVPHEILEECEGFIFDKDNHIEDLSAGIVYWQPTEFFTVYSPYLFYGSTNENSYCFAAFKNFLNGINYSYQLGYDLAHIVEYDAVIRSEEFEENKNMIEVGKCDCIIYKSDDSEMCGTYFCLRIKDYPTSWNLNLIREEFGKQKNRCESGSNQFLKNWVGEERIKEKQRSLAFDQLVCSIKRRIHFVLYERGENIEAFIHNWGEDQIKNICVYYPEGKITIDTLPQKCWNTHKIAKKSDFFFSHLFVENELIKKIDISSEEDYKKYVLLNKIDIK